MAGAPSTLDLFDYKPELIKLAGKPLPDSFAKNLKTATDGGVGNLLATKRTWKQYGETGAWVSDFLPNLAKQVDDIAFLKGCKTEGATHIISSLKLHTAGLVPGRPALGSWVQYALGSANPDLPAFVVLPTGVGAAGGGRGAVIWNSGFLPAAYQGTAFRKGDSPILHLARPEGVIDTEQRNTLDLIASLNEHGAIARSGDTELAGALEVLRARLPHGEVGAGGRRPDQGDRRHARALRHRHQGDRRVRHRAAARAPAGRAQRALHPRHLRRAGQRRRQLGRAQQPREEPRRDEQDGRQADRRPAGRPEVARPAGVDARGVDVRVRPHAVRPERQRPRPQPLGVHELDGRRRHQAGQLRQTDEIGLRAQTGIVDTYDLQATILHRLGLDNRKVTFQYQGRQERPTTVFGDVIKEILA